MSNESSDYFTKLKAGKLSSQTLDAIFVRLKEKMKGLESVSPDLLKRNKQDPEITEYLSKLKLSKLLGNRSWEGLVIGFPGTKEDLAIKKVSTPYLRKILYPILDLHKRQEKELGRKLRCIYFVGERFSEVFIRKMSLLRSIIPDVIFLSGDLYKCSLSKSHLPKSLAKPHQEGYVQKKLCESMEKPNGLKISLGRNTTLQLGHISHEVPCSEGTQYPERLDILGYDMKDKSLVAFEIKGPRSQRTDYENLFLQAIDHRNWLERNKKAVKFLLDNGPNGKRINTKKRVHLLIGFFNSKIPKLFPELYKQAKKRDLFLKIDFVKIAENNGEIDVSPACS